MAKRGSRRRIDLSVLVRAHLEENPDADFPGTVAWLRSQGYTITGDGGKRLRQKWERCREEVFGSRRVPGLPSNVTRAGRYGRSQVFGPRSPDAEPAAAPAAERGRPAAGAEGRP